VSYGREGWKVHCKLCLIERREQARTIRYAYLGTGNFNERTATVYADLGLWTAHVPITREVAAVFEHLSDPRRAPETKHLLVAPTGLRSGIERAIDREIANALRGKPSGLLLKMNSLEDRSLIRKLYDASRAGVPVRLIVRGICCLVPGVPGLSDRIEAISIVDRFLEHARAYVFMNNGAPLVYLASADLMERNMDRRVEVAFPLLHADVRQQVVEYLEHQWADVAKSRAIDAAQQNAYRHRNWKLKGALRSQIERYHYLKGGARHSPGHKSARRSS
jgi:polyphosphate kinase